MSKKALIALVLVLCMALGLRLALVAKSHDGKLTGDQLNYDAVGWNLANGHGYVLEEGKQPTATRGPSYCLPVAAIYTLAGHSPRAVEFCQAFLDCGSCLLVFAICSLAFKRREVGLVGAALYALYPPFFIHTRYVLTETAIDFYILLSIYGFLRYRMRGSIGALALSACGTALAVLAKPVFIVMPAIFVLASWKELCGRRLVVIAVQAGIIAVIMSPWIVRNALVFRAFVPAVTQGGVTFWGGTGPDNGRVIASLDDPGVPAYVLKASHEKNELQADKWFYREGLQVIKDHPGRYALVAIKKVPRLWFNLSDQHHDIAVATVASMGVNSRLAGLFNLAFAAMNAMIIALAVLGIVLLKPAEVATRSLVLMAAYVTLVHMVFFAVFRYSLPVYAFLMCFAAAGLVGLADRLPRAFKGVAR